MFIRVVGLRPRAFLLALEKYETSLSDYFSMRFIFQNHFIVPWRG